MSVGIVMLVHQAFERAEQVARHWADNGCPVVIHVDKRVPKARFDRFKSSLEGHEHIGFVNRKHVNWGSWSMVAVTQRACATMLEQFPAVGHVLLTSGSCLPLRPVADLTTYLAAHPDTDFIESVTTRDVHWTTNGLERERFTQLFPFGWKRQRRLFDLSVRLQRRLRFTRKQIPDLEPHLGSQWWCLSRATLRAILDDPDRAKLDRWFSWAWIPDESYFQTLARKHSCRIESKSLTLSKFDHQGKPHVFYDDHLQLLQRSDCFVARKIWPQAEGLYRAFLRSGAPIALDPNPVKIDRIFAKALARRTQGRAGLFMQSRFPAPGSGQGKTAAPYNVIWGLSDLIEDAEPWLQSQIGGRLHGHLYHPERAQFAGRVQVFTGGLSASARLRDYRPEQFLSNLIWTTRGEVQSFLYGPGDVQTAMSAILSDPNARIAVISGAWAVPLFRSGRPIADLRAQAAGLQAVERQLLLRLRSDQVLARVLHWNLSDFMEMPNQNIRTVLGTLRGRHVLRLETPPSLHALEGFSQFLRGLRNAGMTPSLVGDFQKILEEAESH